MEEYDPENRLTIGRGLLMIGPMFCQVVPATFDARSKHNELVAIKTRACVRPRIDIKKLRKHDREWIKTAINIIPHPKGFDVRGEVVQFLSFDEWNSEFPLGKRKRNYRARELLLCGDYDEKDFRFETFIKREAFPFISEDWAVDYDNERCRQISGIAVIPKVATGPFMKTLSIALKKTWHKDGRICYAAGMSADDINSWVNSTCDRFQDPVFICTDFSKFDCTQGKTLIKNELEWLSSLGASTEIPGWTHYKKVKLQTKAYGKYYAYSVDGTRKSGENETSLGNTRWSGLTLMFAARRFAEDTSIDCYASMVMGDDTITIIDGSVLNPLDVIVAIEEASNTFGFDLKASFSRNPIDVDFLSMRFYPTENGICVGKMVQRNLCKMGCIQDNGKSFRPDELRSILRSNLLSSLPTTNHVPFLRVYVQILLNELGWDYVPVPKYEHRFLEQWTGTIHHADEVTWEAVTKRTGLTEQDELKFAFDLAELVQVYGITGVFDMPLIRDMDI
jgi:hypothetical protein